MSFCFNNREGNVEIKRWWSGLSGLCHLLDKAPLSELQSVRGDRISKMVVGWKQTRRRPGDGHGDWGGCTLMWLEMPHKLESYEEEGVRVYPGKMHFSWMFSVPECMRPARSNLCVSFEVLHENNEQTFYSRFETSKLNESCWEFKCIKDGVCLRFFRIEFKFCLFLVFIFICPACGS